MNPDETESNQEASEKSANKITTDEETLLNDEMKPAEKIQSSVINPIEQNTVKTNTTTESCTELKETDKSYCNMEDEEDDDVPGDFFDDFLNDDFMAALDVIDDDTYDSANVSPEVPYLKKQIEENQQRVESRTMKECDQEGTSTKSNQDNIKLNDIGFHRDPIKTKRDIELDKARCERNREMKRIAEKLKLVETGMVPPGMEMETNIEETEKVEVLDKKEMNLSIGPKRSSRNKSKGLKTSNKTRSSSRSPTGTTRKQRPSNGRFIHNPTRDKRTSSLNASDRQKSLDRRDSSQMSRDRRDSPQKSRDRRDSPQKSRDRRDSPQKSRDHRDSPQKSRDRRDSPQKSRDRRESPLWSRRSRESRDIRKSPIRSRDRRESPKRIHRLNSPLRSRDRRESSRERRISRNHNSRRSHERSRSHNSRRSQERSRSHSRDRRRRRSRSLQRKREEKKSFLQEIAEKLRNQRPFESSTSANIYHHNPQCASLSAPTQLPAPLMSVQYPLQPQSYNPNFFIGTTQKNILPSQPVHYQVGSLDHMQNQIHQPTVHHQEFGSMSVNFNQSQTQNNSGFHTMVGPHNKLKANDNIDQFYKNEENPVTDFLTNTTDPEDLLSPEQMTHKIEVINRCQHAIMYLENTKKRFTGPLILRKDEKEMSQQEKFKSPLLKSLDFKLGFTEIPKTTEHKRKLSAYVDDLLNNQGLLSDVVVIDDEPEVNCEIPNSSSISSTAPLVSSVDDNTGKSRKDGLKLSKPSDMPKCLVCEKRSQIVTKSIGVQCSDDLLNLKYSVSTQVREDAFIHSFPKNQSLASLTPAQLLAGSAAGPFRTRDVDDYNMIPRKKTRPFDFPKQMIPPQQAPRPPRGIFNRPAGPEANNKYNYF